MRRDRTTPGQRVSDAAPVAAALAVSAGARVVDVAREAAVGVAVVAALVSRRRP